MKRKPKKTNKRARIKSVRQNGHNETKQITNSLKYVDN